MQRFQSHIISKVLFLILSFFTVLIFSSFDIREEQHMKQYLEATALKEQEARKKLADFMEELLQRAEYAESKLRVSF